MTAPAGAEQVSTYRKPIVKRGIWMIAGRSRWVRTSAVIALVALVAVGCGSKEESTADSGSVSTVPSLYKPTTGTPRSGGLLTFGTEAEVSGWNPTVDRWDASGIQIGVTVMDPLVAFDANFEAQPYLAESLTPNADYTEWDIEVRSGVQFHDGTPLNAAAVKKSVDAFAAAPLTGAAFADVASTKIIDDLTLGVMMKRPWAAFPYSLGGQAGVVPAPAQLDSGTESSSRIPIGTGPFVFKSWSPDKSFDATRNSSYWRSGLPYLDEVVFKPIPDSSSRIAALQTGDINVTVTSRNDDIAKLTTAAEAGQVQLAASTGPPDTNSVLLNTAKAPMDDIRVRQAMAYAIDKSALEAVTVTDPSLSADSVFAPDSKFYAKTDYPTYDVDKAKQLVQAYEADKGPITFELGATTDPLLATSAQLLQQEFTDVGMEVSVKSLEQSAYIVNAVTGNYQAQLWRQFGAPDPDGNYVWFIGANAVQPLALNAARNQDPELDAALNTQRASADFATRRAAWATIQQRQTADLPYLWLSRQPWVIAAGNTVRGLDGGTLPDGSPAAGLVDGVMRLTEFSFEK
jgi:peptide/nickel transport system substrate-binding protein